MAPRRVVLPGGGILTPDQLRSIGNRGGSPTLDMSGSPDIESIVVDNSGRGMAALGEAMEKARDQALTRPTIEEIMSRRAVPNEQAAVGGLGAEPAVVPVSMSPRESPLRSPTSSQGERSPIQTVNALEVIPNEMVISNYNINGNEPMRIDTGVGGRTDIMICNMSMSVVWVNLSSSVFPAPLKFVGIPLRAMTGATNFDGGVVRAKVRNSVQFWAIGQTPGVGPFLMVVVESAIR